MMRHVQPNVIIAPVILTQDETTQDGSNRRTLKPMYAQFANVRMPHRNQTWTRVCVGYIRTPNKNQKPKGMSKAEFARAIPELGVFNYKLKLVATKAGMDRALDFKAVREAIAAALDSFPEK